MDDAHSASDVPHKDTHCTHDSFRQAATAHAEMTARDEIQGAYSGHASVYSLYMASHAMNTLISAQATHPHETHANNHRNTPAHISYDKS